MFKRFLYLLLIIVPFIAKAQLAVGDWRVHSLFGNTLTNIIDTNDRVYVLSSGSLYSYDKAGQELEAYTMRNKLFDVGIKNIYYNHQGKYLVVVYANSNIDFVYDSGEVFNLPDIKNVVMSHEKDINSVSFGGDFVYVSTKFGYVVLNEKKHEVKESHILGISIGGAAVVGDRLVVADKAKIYWDKADKRIIDLSSFSYSMAVANIADMFPVGDNSFAVYTGWGSGYVFNEQKTALIQSGFGDVFSVQKSGDGVLVHTKAGTLQYWDAAMKIQKTINLPGAISKSARFSSVKGDGNYWILSPKGIKNSIIADNGTETVLTDFFKPNASTVEQPYLMVYNKALDKLYVMNQGPDQYHGAYNVIATVNTLNGLEWSDVTPQNVPNSSGGLLRDPYQPIFDPADPNTYYIGSWFSGVYKVTDNKVVANYFTNNSPLVLNWNCNVPSLQFDNDGNLWLFQTTETTNIVNPVYILTPDKQKKDDKVVKEDWICINVPGFMYTKKMHVFFPTKTNVKLLTDGTWGSVLLAYDDNKTVANAADDKIRSFSNLIDQDDKPYEWSYINCFIEDKNGRVWMGTSNGVVEFNAANMFSSNFRINRLKVPRNDGTIYADYLLENENVMCMAVDGANRKWIGTQTSGLFLVSEDGSQVLNHFTTENSFLPDNYITSVACNPNSNAVYIGTLAGIVEYSSDSAPAESNYDNVLIYPNPVRPDYTGWITVKGLMDNSLIKIADAVGSVVYSGVSTGGMISWDGNTPNGEPAKTGVYYVFASSNDGGKNEGKIGKLLIVR